MVSTVQLQKDAYLMAGLFERLQVTVEDRGASPSAYYRARVVFTRSGPIGRSMGSGMIALDGVFVSDEEDSQRPADHAEDPPPWDLTINAKDLRDAVGAVRTASTRLGHLVNRGGQGLLIQAEDGEGEYVTILLGFERQ